MNLKFKRTYRKSLSSLAEVNNRWNNHIQTNDRRPKMKDETMF